MYIKIDLNESHRVDFLLLNNLYNDEMDLKSTWFQDLVIVFVWSLLKLDQVEQLEEIIIILMEPYKFEGVSL